jgi:hypothetical protein
MTCAGTSISMERRKTVLDGVLLWNKGWKKSSLDIGIYELLIVIFVSTILCKTQKQLSQWKEEVDLEICFHLHFILMALLINNTLKPTKKQIKKPNISLNVTAELILVKRNISCLFWCLYLIFHLVVYTQNDCPFLTLKQKSFFGKISTV